MVTSFHPTDAGRFRFESASLERGCGAIQGSRRRERVTACGDSSGGFNARQRPTRQAVGPPVRIDHRATLVGERTRPQRNGPSALACSDACSADAVFRRAIRILALSRSNGVDERVRTARRRIDRVAIGIASDRGDGVRRAASTHDELPLPRTAGARWRTHPDRHSRMDHSHRPALVALGRLGGGARRARSSGGVVHPPARRRLLRHDSPEIGDACRLGERRDRAGAYFSWSAFVRVQYPEVRNHLAYYPILSTLERG